MHMGWNAEEEMADIRNDNIREVLILKSAGAEFELLI